MHSAVTAVPFLDLTEEYGELEAEWLAGIRETGARGSFILGPNVSAFEQEAAAYIGARHAVAVANGTDALVLSLRALGIGPGDEVITTPFTFFASAEAISLVGATPVFADIRADSFNIDADSVRERVTGKTRAILPVHIFGHPAEMDAIMAVAGEHGLAVIEDCAQAFGATAGGARVGSIGDTGCFSFYPTKVLGCYGDGGMITTNSSEIAEHLRKLRNHGATRPFIHDEIGANSRLDEIQAALLRIKLRRVDEAIGGRRKVAAEYARRLAGSAVTPPGMPVEDIHVFNLYTLRSGERERLRGWLSDNGVGTSLCYPQGLHLQEVYRSLGYHEGELPVAEQASRETLSVPIYPGMPQAHIDRVCELLLGPEAG